MGFKIKDTDPTDSEGWRQIESLRRVSKERKALRNALMLRQLRRANGEAVAPLWVEQPPPRLTPLMDEIRRNLSPTTPQRKSKGERKRASTARRRRERKKR